MGAIRKIHYERDGCRSSLSHVDVGPTFVILFPFLARIRTGPASNLDTSPCGLEARVGGGDPTHPSSSPSLPRCNRKSRPQWEPKRPSDPAAAALLWVSPLGGAAHLLPSHGGDTYLRKFRPRGLVDRGKKVYAQGVADGAGDGS